MLGDVFEHGIESAKAVGQRLENLAKTSGNAESKVSSSTAVSCSTTAAPRAPPDIPAAMNSMAVGNGSVKGSFSRNIL